MRRFTREEYRESLLVPGRNCWRVEEAKRAAFLVDGASYFSVLADALEMARRQVLILGWDIHGGARLRRGRDGHGDDRLEPFLERRLRACPELHVHILEWDFSFLFALERDWRPLWESGWTGHRRLHFRFDDTHPFGASHHQKVVVIDDAIAFAGGLDLTQRRWDTSEHRDDDERRLDPGGESYPPFHDVQMAVDGKAAVALGELARERWLRATGRRLEAPRDVDGEAWPESLHADLEDVRVGIARTFASTRTDTDTDTDTETRAATEGEIREVERLYLDAIDAADRHLYFENQYFTSRAVVEALERRLREPNGPEVLMVLPRDCSGWLEDGTMGLLRARHLRRLRAADQHGRFHACYPTDPSGSPINVHAKVSVVDDRLVRVGSSNLSNRSMGFDSECDLAIEAPGEDVAARIAAFRHRLLGEHLDASPDEIAFVLEAEGSLGTVLERFCHAGGERTLRRIPDTDDEWRVLVPDETVVDPDGVESPKRSVEEFVTEDVSESSRHPWVRVLVALGILLGLSASWRWTALGEWVNPTTVTAWVDSLPSGPAAAGVAVGSFVVASLLMVPVTGLILLTALAFPMLEAVLYSLAGAVLSGLAGFAIGHHLARDTVRRLAGRRLNRVSRLLGRGGVLAVIALRVLPVAPYTIANIVAGASHISWRDFTLGTALGLAPGILAVNLFESQARSAIREPGVGSVVVLLFVAVAVLFGVALAHRVFKRLGSHGS